MRSMGSFQKSGVGGVFPPAYFWLHHLHTEMQGHQTIPNNCVFMDTGFVTFPRPSTRPAVANGNARRRRAYKSLVVRRAIQSASANFHLYTGRTLSSPCARTARRRSRSSILFGSGRHLFLVPGGQVPNTPFVRTLIAWNGSRESARALAEAMPYLYKAKATTVVVVDENHPAELQALIGLDAVNHLRHHGIDARLHRVRNRTYDVAPALIEEAERLEVDLMVMGGYGHSRLREMLLGGVTYDLLHQAPVPLIIAH
jgi:nucleotide-binding universal stress UspA family protein